MPEPIVIYVPEALPSLNETDRQHWGRKIANRKRWARIILAERLRQGAAPATGKRRVTIERHGKRKLDPDNLAGGCKGFIDELRAAGLLVDDNPNAMELCVLNAPLGKGQKAHTIIILEDVK